MPDCFRPIISTARLNDMKAALFVSPPFFSAPSAVLVHFPDNAGNHPSNMYKPLTSYQQKWKSNTLDYYRRAFPRVQYLLSFRFMVLRSNHYILIVNFFCQLVTQWIQCTLHGLIMQ